MATFSVKITSLPSAHFFTYTRYQKPHWGCTVNFSSVFPEGDGRGAVRELASAEGLAPQDGDTLRALK